MAFQTLNLAMIVFSALMMWKGLMVVTQSDSPVVVVLRCASESAPRPPMAPPLTPAPAPRFSGSMEPAFQRGDILFLTNYEDPISVGEIVVFKIAGRDIPIVHRVLKVHERMVAGAAGVPKRDVDYLTKGDNNPIDDRNLYAQDQMWLRRGEILGRAKASVPYVGFVTIMLNDYPALKYVLIGLMGLFVLTGKEQ